MGTCSVLQVIIPVKNGEEFIGRCLDSLFNQSLKEIEVLVVDDGSIDRTPEILDVYSKQHSNLSVIRHPNNLGTGAARNTGLKYANCKYIAFLDADDWIDTNAYLEMINALEQTNADIALSGIRTEYGSPIISYRR